MGDIGNELLAVGTLGFGGKSKLVYTPADLLRDLSNAGDMGRTRQARLQEGQAENQRLLEAERRRDIETQRSQAEATRTRDAARQRQLALTTWALGRADTILTSPLGKVGEPETVGKKILGG